MAREIDTAQQRAVFITGECRCHDGYKCRQLIDPDCVYHNYADDIAEAIQQTRRAALEAVIADIRKALQLYGNDEWRERKALQEWIDHFVERNNKVALDRLREGVGNE